MADFFLIADITFNRHQEIIARLKGYVDNRSLFNMF